MTAHPTGVAWPHAWGANGQARLRVSKYSGRPLCPKGVSLKRVSSRDLVRDAPGFEAQGAYRWHEVHRVRRLELKTPKSPLPYRRKAKEVAEAQ